MYNDDLIKISKHLLRNAIAEVSASNMSAPKAVSSISGKIQVCSKNLQLQVVKCDFADKF